MNNRAARNTVNRWLTHTGRKPLSEELDYIGFANGLATIIEPGKEPFGRRAKALDYIRSTANDVGT